MNSIKVLKSTLSFILCICLLVTVLTPVNAVTVEDIQIQETIDLTEQSEISGDNTQIIYTENMVGVKDYSIPDNSNHAYNIFAQKETVEETIAYRNEVQYEEGKIIYKVTEDAEETELGKAGINISEAKEISRSDGEITYVAETKKDVWETVDALSETEGVVNAQPNYLYEDTAIGVPEIVNNPDMGKQWYYNQENLNAKDAWQSLYDDNITAGQGSIVAIIDTGVDYTHQDLSSNMWMNIAELRGTPGFDDDKNGYVDDIYGCSTVGATNEHTGDPMDSHGHGTHVAGVVAMTANNKKGGAGLAYGCKIMGIKAGSSDGVFSDTDIVEAINYAKTMGADVINMSFSGAGESFLVQEALLNAAESCVLVAAAGNDGVPTTDAKEGYLKKRNVFPAGYPFVLGVMASDKDNNLAPFSNWDYYSNIGSAEYEIVAPGVDIFSTLPGNQYAVWDGTSMAAPFISAMAALLRSQFPDKDDFTSKDIMGQIVSATQKLIHFTDKENCTHSFPLLDLINGLNRDQGQNLFVKSTYLFDSSDIESVNDGDGTPDAGETIDLGVVVRNQWGTSSNVTVSASSESPYVEWLISSAEVGKITAFSQTTNSLVYEDDMPVGTDNPIRFKISEDCPNDEAIEITITITSGSFEGKDNISFMVQKGRSFGGRITEDTVLSNSYLWIIDEEVLVEEQATLTIEPGTQVIANRKIYGYGNILAEGTEDAPVEMYLKEGIEMIGEKDLIFIYANIYGGTITTDDETYAKANHVHFDNVKTADFGFDVVSYSKLYNPAGEFFSKDFDTVQFCEEDENATPFVMDKACIVRNCTFLQGNTKVEYPVEYAEKYMPIEFKNIWYNYVLEQVYEYNGKKYALVYFEDGLKNGDYGQYCLMSNLAKFRGGDLMCIGDSVEYGFAYNGIENAYVGLESVLVDGKYVWQWKDGSDYMTLTETAKKAQGVQLIGRNLTYNLAGNIYALEFPASVSDNVILSQFTLEEYIRCIHSDFYNNALLNSPYTDKFQTRINLATAEESSVARYVNIKDNFWGTENEKIIAGYITDGADKITLPEVVYTPVLTKDSSGTASVYPFVVDAYITDTDGNRIDSCGREEIQLHVEFNRNMNTETQPLISFGKEAPYTEYPVEGSFVNPQHWVGTVAIDATEKNGTMYIRIQDAVSSDDSFLSTGDDQARFSFDIENTDIEALKLQATGGEDKINLTWTQDDYATLAGYNIYRSTYDSPVFEKINSHLIPPTIREYVDENVEAGVDYFYYFTVMGTDFTESAPSNVKMATALDNVKPVLSHSRVTSAIYGQPIYFSATATDNLEIEYVRLYYRGVGEESWKSLDMTLSSDNEYFTGIGAGEVSVNGMEYYIEVSDGTSLVCEGSSTYPISIEVDYSLVIYSVSPGVVDRATEKDVTAIVNGVNFTETMTLTVGEQEVPYTYLSDSQISFVIPEGSIGRVDITLTDGDRKDTFSNAISYKDSSFRAQLSTESEIKAGDTIRIPVVISATGDITAVDIKLKLDKSLFTSIKFEPHENNSHVIKSCASSASGIVRISMSSSEKIDTSVPVGYLILTASDVTQSTYSVIEVTSVLLNAVALDYLVDCNVVIRPDFSISGVVKYYSTGEVIPGVKVTLSNGMETYTDENGCYTFTGISDNEITITASLEGLVNYAVTAEDAAVILKAVTGEGEALEYNRFLAADTDGDGVLTANDASYVLKKSVGLIKDLFPGSGKEWTFAEGVRTIKLTSDVENMDFTGILLGDVTGNWTKEPEQEIE